MTDEELKNKCKERAKIFQQAMESCKSSSPMDCIEWFADRIAELESENEQIKNSDTLCKSIGEQKRKIIELEQQIEKMKTRIKEIIFSNDFVNTSPYQNLNNKVRALCDFYKEIKEK